VVQVEAISATWADPNHKGDLMTSDIEQRLAWLERSNRRFRWALLTLLLAFPCLAAVWSQDKPGGPLDPKQSAPAESNQRPKATGRTLEDVQREYGSRDTGPSARASSSAEEEKPRKARIVDSEVFAVVDRQGRVRAELGADDHDRCCLRMHDKLGNLRAELMQIGGLTNLQLFGPDGTPLIELRQADNHAQITVGAKEEVGTAPVRLLYDGGNRGVDVRGEKPGFAVALEVDRSLGPQLNLTGGPTHAEYRSNGMHSASDAGGLGLYLDPGRRAALHMSACRPVAGQEGVEISTTSETASLSLNSLGHRSAAHLTVRPETTILGLRSSAKEGVIQWSIRDRGEHADSSVLMRSGRENESMEMQVQKSGPRMRFVDAEGKSLLILPRPEKPTEK